MRNTALIIHPESDVSAIHQRLVIFYPVTGGVFVFPGGHAEPEVFVLTTKNLKTRNS
jgi:hypothetical protein